MFHIQEKASSVDTLMVTMVVYCFKFEWGTGIKWVKILYKVHVCEIYIR